MTLGDFAEFLKSAKPTGPFKIEPIREPVTGATILYWENTPSHEDWINDRVSLMRADDDDRVIGVEIRD